jgi:hypothetical protein
VQALFCPGVPGSVDAEPPANTATNRPSAKARLARMGVADDGTNIAFVTASSFCRRRRGAVVVTANTEKIVREM